MSGGTECGARGFRGGTVGRRGGLGRTASLATTAEAVTFPKIEPRAAPAISTAMTKARVPFPRRTERLHKSRWLSWVVLTTARPSIGAVRVCLFASRGRVRAMGKQSHLYPITKPAVPGPCRLRDRA